MPAKINKQCVLHKGRAFDFVKENVTLSNGVTVDIEVVRHPGASAVVAFLQKETILLIKQYRHALGNFIWEIPAGTLSPMEAADACARRELIEETGYDAKQWERLGEITPVPGYSDERVHLFLATQLSTAQQSLDPDEIIDIHTVEIKDALKMIERGEIQDAKSICGIFLALNRLKKGLDI